MGVIALYALLFQAFLTVSAPGALLRQAGILCADQAPGGPVDGPAHHHDHSCCTLAHSATIVPPSLVEAVAGPRFALTTIVVWRPEASIPRTGPPTYAASARGPPLV